MVSFCGSRRIGQKEIPCRSGYPQMVWSESRKAKPAGRRVQEGFSYSSGNNTEWLSVEDIRNLLATVDLEK